MKSKKVFFFSFLIASLLSVWSGCGDDDDNNDSDDDTSPGDDDDAAPDDDDETDDDDNDTIPDDDDDTGPGETFRIAVISEPLVATGNDDYLFTGENLSAAVEAINDRDDVEFVIVLGDLAAQIRSYDDTLTDPWETAIAAFASIMDGLAVPYYVAPGEKDYTVLDNQQTWPQELEFVEDWDERNAALHSALGVAYAADWSVVTHNGVDFFLGNSFAGDDRDTTSGNIGSLGAVQLAEAAAFLATTDLAVIVTHHPATMMFEGAGQDPLLQLLTESQGVIGLCSGHLMQYKELDIVEKDAFYFGAVYDNAANYAILEIDPVAGSVTVINRDDLPWHEPPQDLACTPGVDGVGTPTDFIGSYHTIIFDAIDLGPLNFFFPISDPELFAMALWVLQQDDAAYDIMATFGKVLVGEGFGAHVTHNPAWPAPCEILHWTYADPCLTVTDSTIGFDLLKVLDAWGEATACGLTMDYLLEDFSIDAQLAAADKANATFDWIDMTMTVSMAGILEAFEQFLVDAYCAYDCETDLLPQDDCDAVANGHQAACDAGTLTFDEAPAQCDYAFGLMNNMSTRMLISMLKLFPDWEITPRVNGWGHEAVPFNNGDFWGGGAAVDWAMDIQSFFDPGSGAECPTWP